MKKSLLSIIIFLAAMKAMQAQTLYSVTKEGGIYGKGTINKFLPATNTLSVVHSFEGFQISPDQTFIQQSDGKIYGTLSGLGGIFSYDPAASTITRLNMVDATTDLFFPMGNLVPGSDGKFYGYTRRGAGVAGIFSFDRLSSTVTTIKEFDGTDGQPQGSLVQAGNGKLYGMTANGGTNNFGVIFSFDPSTSTYTKLKDLEGGHNNALLQASNGNLYGVTTGGGSNNYGVVFSVDTATAAYTAVFNFDVADAGPSFVSLTEANNGKLYGVKGALEGSSTQFIFSFDLSGSTYAREFNLVDGTSNGSPLTQATDGKLYGMGLGGISFNSVIFSFDPSTSVYAVSLDFGGNDGIGGGLLQASNGKLYALTSYGGPNFDLFDEGGIYLGQGFMFSFDPSSSALTIVKDNNVAQSGQSPLGSVILAIDGKLYGVTTGGGKGYGVIYSFDTLTSTYTKLKDFENNDGSHPCGIMQANNGKLFGLTTGGGNQNTGVIFSFDPSTATFTKLKDLTSADGVYPLGNLVQASNGKLFGLTTGGGNQNTGVIFSFDPLTSIYTKLLDFVGTNGSDPSGTLLEAGDGKLYGMTRGGGSHGEGVIFSFDPATNTYAKLMDFSSTEGAIPAGSLIQASNGKLYGLTNGGGNLGNPGSKFGVIFSYDPLTSTYVKLHDFDGINGSSPYGSLVQASNAKLYGMTYAGGSKDLGVIFSFNPASPSTYTKLKDFDYSNGAHPWYSSAFIEVLECTTNLAFYKDADGDGYGDPYTMKIALKQPAGYVTDNTDCDDKSKALHPTIYYRDADEDNLGDANISTRICSVVPPPGYVKNNNDNDDHKKLQYALSNYPNPFERTSTIKYDLPFDSHVSIKVYDLLGRVVAILVDEDKKIGIYTAVFKTNHSGQGVLYYKIIGKSKDQQFEQTNKMIQLR